MRRFILYFALLLSLPAVAQVTESPKGYSTTPFTGPLATPSGYRRTANAIDSLDLLTYSVNGKYYTHLTLPWFTKYMQQFVKESFIKNQNATVQTGNFDISGVGKASAFQVGNYIQGAGIQPFGSIVFGGARFNYNTAASNTLGSQTKYYTSFLDTVNNKMVFGDVLNPLGGSQTRVPAEFKTKTSLTVAPVDPTDLARLQEVTTATAGKADTVAGGYQRHMWFDVTDPKYAGGAKKDSSANAAPAFQAAINAAKAAGGGTVYIPAGRYRWDNAVYITGTTITIVGDGMKYGLIGSVKNPPQPGSSIYYSGTDTAALVIDTIPGKKVNGFVFNNFSIDNVGTKDKIRLGIYVKYAPQFKIDHVSTSSFGTNLKVERGSHEYTLDNFYAQDSYLYGVDLNNVTQPDYGDQMITNSIFKPHDSTSVSAIYIRGAGGLRLIGNKVNGSGTPDDATNNRFFKHALQIANSAGASGVLVAVGNSFENVWQEAIYQGTSAFGFGQLVISSNEFLGRNGSYSFIRFAGTMTDCTITGNLFPSGLGATTPAIYLGASTSRVFIGVNRYPVASTKAFYVTNLGTNNQSLDVHNWGTDGRITAPSLIAKTTNDFAQYGDVTAVTSAMSNGQVAYKSGTNLAGSNSLFWDATNNRFGVGTVLPESGIHSTSGIRSTSGGFAALEVRSDRTLSTLNIGGLRWLNATSTEVAGVHSSVVGNVMIAAGNGSTSNYFLGVFNTGRVSVGHNVDNGVDGLNVKTSVISGLTGTSTGAYKASGATSGTVTIQPQAAAGTYNFNLPTTAGTAGQVLTSQGGGATAMTWTDMAKFGSITLVAGVGTATVTGVTTGSFATTGFVSPGGTITTTWQYKVVCTANTVTITAITNTGTTNTTDTSVLNYSVKL